MPETRTYVKVPAETARKIEAAYREGFRSEAPDEDEAWANSKAWYEAFQLVRAPETKTPVGEALERAAQDITPTVMESEYDRTFPSSKMIELRLADARTLRALADAIGHQPIMFCAEKENPITDDNKGTDRVCGWCAGCRLAALLEGGLEDGS